MILSYYVSFMLQCLNLNWFFYWFSCRVDEIEDYGLVFLHTEWSNGLVIYPLHMSFFGSNTKIKTDLET